MLSYIKVLKVEYCNCCKRPDRPREYIHTSIRPSIHPFIHSSIHPSIALSSASVAHL